ncbi:hypothetical protein ID866_8684 [Astraeus odoratus]|nr:hypothetical protein ID866_8684 [Astraeus odoratus]
MSTGNKSVMPINWQEVPDKELGLDKADPEDVTMAKLQEKFWKAEEAKKRVCKAEAQHWEAAVVERQREAEHQEAKRAKGAWLFLHNCLVVDRRMGKVVKELWGLREGVATMAKSNQDLAWVLYCRFQSMDTLVDEVQIFGAEGFLPKPEECLEWAMECLQMRKEWMQQEKAALTKHLKGKGKELAKKSKQEEEQGTGDEEKEGEAE